MESPIPKPSPGCPLLLLQQVPQRRHVSHVIPRGALGGRGGLIRGDTLALKSARAVAARDDIAPGPALWNIQIFHRLQLVLPPVAWPGHSSAQARAAGGDVIDILCATRLTVAHPPASAQIRPHLLKLNLACKRRAKAEGYSRAKPN